LPEDHDSNDQDETDKKIENNHVKTTEQDGFSREVDFCQHGFGGVEGADRTLNRIDENLPQQCAHHSESRIGYAGASDLHNALGVEENKGHRGDKRRQEGPDIAKEGLPVLRAEIADEEAPSEFTTCPDVLGDRANELGWMAEQRLGGVNANGKFSHKDNLASKSG